MTKIIFMKTIPPRLKSTEEAALEILNNPKYDKYPQFIDKDQIQYAFDEYGYKLNPFNSSIYTNILGAPNIEGHFMAKNIPELDSVVVEGSCMKEQVHTIMDKNSDVTHIALSTYALGLDNAIDVIKILQKDYPETTLFVGGTGSRYPHIQKLIDPQNLCTGEGVSWLREKFGLSPLKPREFKISSVITDTTILPVNMKTVYLVTQSGCPFSCDFCITSKMLQYNPFSKKEDIIRILEESLEQNRKDKFVYICDPNACFPEKMWKDIFEHFMNYQGSYDNYLHLISLISLRHLQKFRLRKIQEESRLKFFLVNFGIESTVGDGYIKNRGVNKAFVDRIAPLGIISNHNFILGLEHHTPDNIKTEIKRNLEYNPCWYFVSTLKPLPTTDIYKKLKQQELLYGEELPPELWYQDGYFPFTHPHLGGGFSALKYAFQAYYETEKKVIDVYSSFADAVLHAPPSTLSPDMQKVIDVMIKLSKMNKTMFKPRMSESLTIQYEDQLHSVKERFIQYTS